MNVEAVAAVVVVAAEVQRDIEVAAEVVAEEIDAK